MKQCAYCGRENVDSATSCSECGTDEFKKTETGAILKDQKKSDLSLTTEAKKSWQAREAWFCTLILAVVSFCFDRMLWYISRSGSSEASLLRSPFGATSRRVVLAALWVGIAFLCARRRSFPEFLRRLNLTAPPSLLGWFVAWLAIGIGWLNLYGVIKGWIPQDRMSLNYYTHGGAVWWSYVASVVLLSPFYEETVIRGFLFRSFRGNYALIPSMFFTLCVFGYFHWNLLRFPICFVSIVIATILLCAVREWTGSLWNCILFHAAYNATEILRWQYYILGMFVLFPLCARTIDWKQTIRLGYWLKNED
jgi:membrane protease YdiL (CAAX protease family)